MSDPARKILSAALSKRSTTDLEWLSQFTEASVTDCVNRAIQVYAFIVEQEQLQGKSILIYDTETREGAVAQGLTS